MDKFAKCPCDSKLLYQKCCKQFHAGVLPPNAEALMRSRYCAYAIGMADYIMDTTHPDHPDYSSNRDKWKKELAVFIDNTQFNQLKVSNFVDGDTNATVTFTAHLRQADQDVSFSEKSTFEMVNGKWLYKSGQMLT